MVAVPRPILAHRRPIKALSANSSIGRSKGNRPHRIRAEEELRSRNRELFALLEIAQTTASGLEQEKILNATLHKSMELFGFDVGYIRTLDKENKNLAVSAASGL